MYAGDTYIFDGEDVVAVYQGVKVRQSLNLCTYICLHELILRGPSSSP